MDPRLTLHYAIAAGATHTLALKNDGTVWAWGLNGVGQLGDGSTSERFTPGAVPALLNRTGFPREAIC